jgi:S-adenosylmethionine-dependent methyltransferase
MFAPMKRNLASAEQERFQSEAEKYASYLETPEGRLRIDLAFANLQTFLPQESRALFALDVGGGTGALSVRLARLGFHVTLLDPSQPMLEFARRAVQESGVADRIELKQGDTAQVPKLFEGGSFDVVVCHNVLEFVDDPRATLRDIARVMRGSAAILSVLVRSQAGEVLKAALLTGDLAAAETSLTAEWGQESLCGGNVRLFTTESLKAMLKEASLTIAAERGVRVLADYLPHQISRSAEYERIFAIERELGSRREFASVARYIQILARLSAP